MNTLVLRLALVIFSLPLVRAAAEDVRDARDRVSDQRGKARHDVASEEMNALREAVLFAEKAYLNSTTNASHGIKDPEERDLLWKVFTQTNDTSVPRLIELVRQDPTSTAAFKDLDFIVVNRRIHARALWPYGLQAVELLRDHHAANPEIGRLCGAIGNNWDPTHNPTIDPLIKVAETNENRTARGQATFAHARLVKLKAEAGTDAQANGASKEAERLLETVLKEYSDIPDLSRSASEKQLLGNAAERELYELRHLSVGCVAPTLEGGALDGRKIALTDYRGKIVAVVFWATWCGPCMQAIPHERTLVERLEGRPFVLLGVNGDEDRVRLKPVLAREGITWRSFWNGGPEGPISAKWNVRAWPTVYVLDGHGVIRFKDVTGKRLDEAVDELMKEADAKAESKQLP